MRNRHRVRTGSQHGFGVVGVTFLCMALFGVTACGSDATNDAGPTVETEIDREASWLANKMRVCVTNSSSAPIALEWDSYMQNGKSAYLKPYELKKTLGPSAFECAVSYAMFGSEIALFDLEGQGIRIENIGLANFDIKIGASPSTGLTSSEAVESTWPSGITEGRSIEARVTTTDELVQYEQIQVYPIDIYVSDGS